MTRYPCYALISILLPNNNSDKQMATNLCAGERLHKSIDINIFITVVWNSISSWYSANMYFWWKHKAALPPASGRRENKVREIVKARKESTNSTHTLPSKPHGVRVSSEVECQKNVQSSFHHASCTLLCCFSRADGKGWYDGFFYYYCFRPGIALLAQNCIHCPLSLQNIRT